MCVNLERHVQVHVCMSVCVLINQGEEEMGDIFFLFALVYDSGRDCLYFFLLPVSDRLSVQTQIRGNKVR